MGTHHATFDLLPKKTARALGEFLILELVSKKPRQDCCWEQHRASVTPADVEKAIGTALKVGWSPSERGAAYKPALSLDLQEFRCREEQHIGEK